MALYCCGSVPHSIWHSSLPHAIARKVIVVIANDWLYTAGANETVRATLSARR
jgi:hypothetical protein